MEDSWPRTLQDLEGRGFSNAPALSRTSSDLDRFLCWLCGNTGHEMMRPNWYGRNRKDRHIFLLWLSQKLSDNTDAPIVLGEKSFRRRGMISIGKTITKPLLNIKPSYKYCENRKARSRLTMSKSSRRVSTPTITRYPELTE